MAIEYFGGNWPKNNYIVNGGEWFVDMLIGDQAKYVEMFDQLPYLIEVETDAGLIGIVHAECPVNDWEELKYLVNEGNDYNHESYRNDCIWSRSRVTVGDCTIIKNIHEIYVGHTPMRSVTKAGNTNYIDTGAVFGNKLTIVKIQ
jgi:serine/threonine protein phosphatase 1